MTEELENQIQAQDCELEYWFQQAENYAVVQIPADDLRAIIARTYAAVNALPELLAKVKRQEEVLEKIAKHQYGYQSIMEDGDDPVEGRKYYMRLAHQLQALARAALKETDQ